MYTIRKSTTADIDSIMLLAKAARQIMKDNGNPTQWTDNHPSRETIEDDVQHADSYVICKMEGEIVGTFVFKQGPDPSYAKIYNGEWIDNTRTYHVIHRIMSTPDAHGIFAAIMDYCNKHADNLRIDTHRNNSIMQHLIKKYGFHYCGIVHIIDLDTDFERLAYQKI